MSEGWNDLAQKGRAAQQAQDQAKAQLRAQWEAAATEKAREAAVWRLSPLALNPLRFVWSLPYVIVWGLTVAMAMPYFIYFATGAPVHGQSKTGDRWVLDPARDGYGLFFPFLVATAPLIAALVWRRLAKSAGAKRVAEESAWAEGLPFPVLGHPTAVGAHDHRYKLTIHFAGNTPPENELRDVMRGVDPFIHADGLGRRSRFVAEYPTNDPPPRNAQRFVASMHTAVDRVLSRLHADCPIDRVEIEG